VEPEEPEDPVQPLEPLEPADEVYAEIVGYNGKL